MNWRNFVAGIVAVCVFVGVIVLMGIVVRSFSPDYSPSQHPIERILMLGVSFFAASIAYGLIKGKEPEQEVKEKEDKISGNEISEKLKEKRMYCSNCGVMNVLEASFCQNCGKELKPNSPE